MSKPRFVLGGILVAAVMSMNVQASADLVHHYLFDETTGTTASDSGTTPANGTLTVSTGTPATPFTFDENAAAGQVGGALSFEGPENDVVQLPDGTLAFGAGEFTIAMWVKRGDLGDGTNASRQGLFGQSSGASGAAGSMWARFDPDNSLRFLVDEGSSAADVIVSNPAFEQTTNWVHLAFVRRGDDLETWVNGVGTTGGTLPSSFLVDGSIQAAIGVHNLAAAANTTFNGAIDDFRVYDTALSQSEIQALVPEPSAIILISMAGLGLAALSQRKRK